MLPIHIPTTSIIGVASSLGFFLLPDVTNTFQTHTSTIALGQAVNWKSALTFSFAPPEDNGRHQINRAGGRRNQLCNNATPAPSLTLLVPPTAQGLTTEKHPTFLLYLPQTPARSAFFKLEDDQNNDHYHVTFPLPERAGIVRFTIPDTAPALEIGEDYRFSLAVVCDAVLDPSDPVVETWIRRIEPNAAIAAQQMEGMSLELAASYANNGLWFDAVNVLAGLRRSQPNSPDVTTAWEELLQSVELDAIQGAALLDDVQ